VLIFCVRILEVCWNVIPMFHDLYAGLGPQLEGIAFYIGSFFGIGGLWLAGFVLNLGRNSLLPASDLATLEVAHHGA
jgi:hypothetical protein